MKTTEKHISRLCLAALAVLMAVTSRSVFAEGLATRDINTVSPGCDVTYFIVSLNDDDDNGNRRADRRERVSRSEDNLRKFHFNQPRAARVFIAAPVFLSDQSSALARGNNIGGKRVRAYQADGRTPFEFNRFHDVPVTMFLEGVGTSAAPIDFGFEYQYVDANGGSLCGSTAVGTVVDVAAEFTVAKGKGSSFESHRKMLIKALGNANATISPRGTAGIKWSYDGAALFSSPDQLSIQFLARDTITPPIRLDLDELRFAVTEYGLTIEAHTPVNITAPVHVTATRGWTNGRPKDSGWINANDGTFSLFNTYIDYRLEDQFGEPIKRSAWDDRMVQIRENIGRVMTSPIPAVATWIQQNLEWTRNWKDKPKGKFRDRLKIVDVSKNILLAQNNSGRRMFHSSLRSRGGVLMNLGRNVHQWEASVNGFLPTVVTNNAFSVKVNRTRPRGGHIQIRFRSTYTLHLP